MSHSIIAHSGLPRRSNTRHETIVFKSAAGPYAFDTHGRNYVDFILGYGSVVLGHADLQFNARVTEMLLCGLHLPAYSSWHYGFIGTLANGVRRGWRAAVFKTASEAVTAAFRLSAARTSKRGVIRCGFCGWHDAALASSPRWHEPIRSPFRHELRYTGGFRGVAGDEGVYNWISLDIEDLARICDATADHVGTLIIDAYQSCFCGYERIEEAIALCKGRGIVVVFDETKTGGRVAPFGYAAERGLDADLIILGKSLANGAPLSVLFGSEEFMSLSEKARITGTFSQELSAIYCGMATFDEMQARDGFNELRLIGKDIVGCFNAAAAEAGIDHLIEVLPLYGGSMFDIVFSDEIIGDWARRTALCEHLAEHGVLALQGHASYVSLSHAEIDSLALKAQLRSAFKAWSACS